MKTLTHLSIFSVLFFSISAFASTGNISPTVNAQTGQEQSVQHKNNCKNKMTTMSEQTKSQSTEQSRLITSSNKKEGKGRLLSNADQLGFNQSQHDSFSIDMVKLDDQFANNMNNDDALASNQITPVTSFSQSQHDFSQPTSLL